MCQGSRGRRDINEHVKSSEPDKQYDVWLFCFFFFSLYMYLSYIFYFKESTIITTEKHKAKQIQKKIQKCGGQVASNSVWLRPSNLDKVLLLSFFFQLVLKLHPYLLAPFTIKGRKSPRSPYLFSYSFPSFGEEQKSLLFVFKVGIQF